jgi:signal transduction histidine kinase
MFGAYLPAVPGGRRLAKEQTRNSMPRSGGFERRLLIALVLFSLVPTLLVTVAGTLILRDAVSLQATPAGWERLGETGRELLDRAEASGDSALVAAARRHRQELTGSIQQAQRWGYLNRRVLEVLPWLTGLLVLSLALLGVRSSRRMARSLARPIHELVGWSERVGRGEPLPPPDARSATDSGEFEVLRQSFRVMEDEIRAARERALEAAAIRASVALARGVAHELKNALTPLQFAVRALRATPALTSAAREPLDVLESESARLDALARAFAQFGKPPEGPSSKVDLRELLEHLARTHLPESVTVRLEGDPDPVIVGHLDALSRAFGNLLLNAAEAMGGDGGAVRVEFRGSADAVETRIVDSGPGIPAPMLDRIWEPDVTTKPRGTGLGLALVRQTVHAHGGSVGADNDPSGGACFTVVLPRRAPGASLADDETSGAPDTL